MDFKAWILTALFFMLFLNSAFSWAAEEIGCVNATTLNETGVIRHCAYGCYMGECLDGTALFLNATFMLMIFWSFAFLMFFIATQINGAEYGLIKTVMFATSILFVFLGVFGSIGVYQKGAGISEYMSNIATTVVDGILPGLVAVFVVYVFYYLLKKMGDVIVKKSDVP